MANLEQIGDVGGHLLDLGVVELLDVLHVLHVRLDDEVDGHALAAETTGAADAVDVVLSVGGEVVVDDQRHLLHVDTTGQQVGGDQHAGGAGAELAHDGVSLALVELSVHGGDGEVLLLHLLGQPVHLSAGVAVDDRLGDRQGAVQVAQGLELPLLAVNGNVELLDT